MITVVGLGFVGLTTALGFSHKGWKVYGVEIDSKRASLLKEKKIPFYEPCLSEVLNSRTDNGLVICGSLKEAVENSRVIFYCVGSPTKSDGTVNLDPLMNAIESTLKILSKDQFRVLVIKSTVPPSTTMEKVKPLIEQYGFQVGQDIGLVNNPEFLREGHAWEDFTNPDRIVLGYDDERSGTIVSDLYASFRSPIFRVSLNTAEFIKYLSNTLLSTLISFSNEMALAANSMSDIDIPEAFKILHLDKRWYGSPAPMTSYVFPGCGFGGSCLPKDTRAIHAHLAARGIPALMLKAVIEVNELAKKNVVEKVCKNVRKEEAIGILGLSFKPDSDDVRDTPAREIIEKLIENGYRNITAYDPLAMDNFNSAYHLDINYAENLDTIVKKSDHLIILTAWDEFKGRKHLLTGKNVMDCRYCLST